MDIHFTETGKGPPLVLLHGGLLSSSPIWTGHPASFTTYMDELAARFRVICPDTRGHGKTPNPSGRPPTYAQLADDLLALIDHLRLDRPIVGGFSDGGMIATLAALRAPSKVRALVTAAGFDVLFPRITAMARAVFGGAPDATTANPDAFVAAMGRHDPGFVRLLQADHGGAWRTVIEQIFSRITTGHPVDELRAMAVPTLVLCGDRDFIISVEDATAVYRAIGAHAELAIVPRLDHALSPAAIAATIAFCQRHS